MSQVAFAWNSYGWESRYQKHNPTPKRDCAEARSLLASRYVNSKNMNSANILGSLPKDLKSELIEDIIRSSSVRIERIVSKGHTSPDSGWYDQDMNEWVMVIEGRASLGFEDGSKCDLAAGDYITIPAHIKHKVVWTDPNQITVWLAVFYK